MQIVASTDILSSDLPQLQRGPLAVPAPQLRAASGPPTPEGTDTPRPGFGAAFDRELAIEAPAPKGAPAVAPTDPAADLGADPGAWPVARPAPPTSVAAMATGAAAPLPQVPMQAPVDARAEARVPPAHPQITRADASLPHGATGAAPVPATPPRPAPPLPRAAELPPERPMDTPVAETLALRQHPVPVDPQPAPRGPVAPVTDALAAEPLDAAPAARPLPLAGSMPASDLPPVTAVGSELAPPVAKPLAAAPPPAAAPMPQPADRSEAPVLTMAEAQPVRAPDPTPPRVPQPVEATPRPDIPLAPRPVAQDDTSVPQPEEEADRPEAPEAPAFIAAPIILPPVAPMTPVLTASAADGPLTAQGAVASGPLVPVFPTGGGADRAADPAPDAAATGFALPDMQVPVAPTAPSGTAFAAQDLTAPDPVSRRSLIQSPPDAPPEAMLSPAPLAQPPQSSGPVALPQVDTARSDWTQAVAGHVIAKVEEGGLELDLAPEHLGRLRVRVEMVDGAARVTFVTETAEAARLLQEAQGKLGHSLSQSGLTLAAHEARSGADFAATGQGQNFSQSSGQMPGQNGDPGAQGRAVFGLPADRGRAVGAELPQPAAAPIRGSINLIA